MVSNNNEEEKLSHLCKRRKHKNIDVPPPNTTKPGFSNLELEYDGRKVKKNELIMDEESRPNGDDSPR